jgi:hypothetical protein
MPVGRAKTVTQPNDKSANTAAAKTTEKKAAAATYLISEEDDELNSGLLKGHQSRKQEDDEINNGFLNDYESRKAAWSNKKADKTAVKQTEQPVEKAPVQPVKETRTMPKKDPFDLKTLVAGSGQYLQNNKNVTRALIAVVLILGGVIIGLVINSGHKQPDTKALESLVKEIRDKQNEKPRTGSATPASEAVHHKNERREEAHRYNESDNSANNDQEPVSEPASQRAVIKKQNSVVTPPQTQPRSITVPASNTNTQPVEATPAVMEPREKPIDKEVIEKARKNIYDQVHVEASAFKVGILGGISDLDITLQNTSPYVLDQVSVEIKYFGPEKKLVKSQTLIFNNVPAGKRRTLEVPSTRRGITIDYSIVSINSKVLGLAQNGF